MLYAIKIFISAAVIVLVSEMAGRSPRLGGLVLSLPIVSILAFVMTWYAQKDNALRILQSVKLQYMPTAGERGRSEVEASTEWQNRWTRMWTQLFGSWVYRRGHGA